MENLDDLRELIQDDLSCLLDGFLNETIEAACLIVADRFQEYEDGC